MDDHLDQKVDGGQVMMSFRLQIPQSSVGSVIGKSGEVIKAIREQSQAKVIIADSVPGSDDRDITIKGPLASVEQAVGLLLLNLFQSRPEGEESFQIKVLVANDQAGAIIGKGGEAIKQLREETGARISIGKKIDFIRTVSLAGSHSTLTAALGRLVHLVHDHPSSARNPFLEGYRPQAQQQQSYRGNQAAAAAAAAAYGYPQANYGVMGGMGYGGMGGVIEAPAVQYAQQQPVGEVSTLTLSVPHRSVGSVIGKRGATINEIRTLSGCRIEVAPQTDSQFRTITLTGTQQSIELAHMMIQRYTFRPYEQQQQQPATQ